jgi:hypothetical protein
MSSIIFRSDAGESKFIIYVFIQELRHKLRGPMEVRSCGSEEP